MRFNRWRLHSATILVAVLVGCSPAESPSSGPPPSPSPTDPVSALSEYSRFPCDILHRQNIVDFLAGYNLDDSEHPPASRQVDDLAEGPAKACYWEPPTGILLGWIPYPSEDKANEPGTQRTKIADYAATQSTDEESCYVNIVLSPGESFSTIAIRTEPDGPEETCGIATSFAEKLIARFKELSVPAR